MFTRGITLCNPLYNTTSIIIAVIKKFSMLGIREVTSDWCKKTAGARSACNVFPWARLFYQSGIQYCGAAFLCYKLVTNLPVCLEKWAVLICSKSSGQLVAVPYSSTLNSYFPRSTAARMLSNPYMHTVAAISKANSQGRDITHGKGKLQFLSVVRIIWEDRMNVYTCYVQFLPQTLITIIKLYQ